MIMIVEKSDPIFLLLFLEFLILDWKKRAVILESLLVDVLAEVPDLWSVSFFALIFDPAHNSPGHLSDDID